jgi:hypothetical protein
MNYTKKLKINISKNLKFLTILFSIIFSTNTYSENYTDAKEISSSEIFSSKIIKSPALNSDNEIESGMSLVEEYIEDSRNGIQVLNHLTGYQKTLFTTYTLKIPIGFAQLASKNSKGIFYLSDEGQMDSSKKIRTSLFIPFDESRKSEICYQEGGFNFYLCSEIMPLQPGIDYIKSSSKKITEQKFKRELIYTGKIRNELTFQYREFINNMARPAFNQELKFDITDDKIIGYKGARFEIISAGNTYIKYKTIKHFFD